VATTPAYDLLVLIDADAPEERRGQILDAIKKQINAGAGELKGDVDWGVRKLAFEINHRGDAYYHLFQLESEPELLKQLEHSLAIDDAVLRHRIIRLPKGVPDRPPRPSPSAPRAAQADEAPAVGEAPEAPSATPESPATVASVEPAETAESSPTAAPEESQQVT
jgi:small subunit ribosomal protein S6